MKDAKRADGDGNEIGENGTEEKSAGVIDWGVMKCWTVEEVDVVVVVVV